MIDLWRIRELAAGLADDFCKGGRDLGRVNIVFPRTLIGDKPLFFELGELCRNPRLPHSEDLLELGD